MEDNSNSASQLRAILEALPYVSWFKDAEGNFSMVNAMLLTTLQKGLFEVVGRRNHEVFDKDEARQNEEIDREILETGRITESTYSRNQRVFKTVHFPVIDDQGRITGTGGFQEDITNLTRSLQELHMEKEYLAALLENMPYYIFFTDRHHRYIRINGMMASLLKISNPNDAIGKGNKDFFSRRVARKMLEEDRNIIDSGEAMLNRIIFFKDDGVDGFWMEKNKIPIRDERGVIIMIIGIFKDVSGMMKIETELKEAKERAEESDRLKTSFLANMSHEIRTPMNGILGFANLLKDPDLQGEKRDLYLKHIEQSSKQLLNIIDDIIDISKIESGQLKISNRPVRINGIMDEIYSSFFHRIRGDAPGQQKVKFNLEKGNESADFTLVADDYRLRQILNNLIGNAIKFTEEGNITFGYVVKNNLHIEFFVRDTGPGIPDNKLGIIFDRFGQLNQASYSQPSGTGLGLSISKNLVKLMGGEMWVESKVNKGSVFRFTLPLVTETAIDEPRVLISNKSYDWTGKRILVAEDEKLNWMFIREMLGKSGAEIVRAEDGNQAVKITRKLKPDVILMDIKMPGLNGIEATRKIRTFNTKVPIIAQTAFVMAEEKEESKQVGCNHFVTKPLDRTVIMELIDSYISISQ
ncbi:MAG: response regulator [Bacteroidetes bacterium]|nr:response regulator [Bacteroidota bacterium]